MVGPLRQGHVKGSFSVERTFSWARIKLKEMPYQAAGVGGAVLGRGDQWCRSVGEGDLVKFENLKEVRKQGQKENKTRWEGWQRPGHTGRAGRGRLWAGQNQEVAFKKKILCLLDIGPRGNFSGPVQRWRWLAQAWVARAGLKLCWQIWVVFWRF